MTIKTISLLTREKILKARLNLLKDIIFLNSKEKEKKEALFSQGKLSVLLEDKIEKMQRVKILANNISNINFGFNFQIIPQENEYKSFSSS